MLISFDCYGTLIDWETGILSALKPVLIKHGLKLSDDEILDMYSEIEPWVEQEFKPYKDVLKGVVEEFGKRLGISISDEEKNVLVDTIGNWPAFPDTKEALSKIKRLGKIAIISNVDNDILEKSIQKMGIEFDYIVTSQMVGAYKPSIEVFEYTQKVFKVQRDNWIHVAQSAFHDVIPAGKFGLKTIWVRRKGFGATPKIKANPDYTVKDLNEAFEVLKKLIEGGK